QSHRRQHLEVVRRRSLAGTGTPAAGGGAWPEGAGRRRVAGLGTAPQGGPARRIVERRAAPSVAARGAAPRRRRGSRAPSRGSFPRRAPDGGGGELRLQREDRQQRLQQRSLR